jgi:hypothetical protein
LEKFRDQGEEEKRMHMQLLQLYKEENGIMTAFCFWFLVLLQRFQQQQQHVPVEQRQQYVK